MIRFWLIWSVIAVALIGSAALATVVADRRLVYLEFTPWLGFLLVGGGGLGLVAALRIERHRRVRSQADQLAAMAAGQAELAQADRRRFLLRLDHELKNPITAVRLGIENLRGATDPSPGRETEVLLVALSGQAIRLSRLTGDLRRLGALEVAELDLAPVSVPELLTEVVSDAADPATGVTVDLVVPRGPWPIPLVRADRDLLQLALFNLVGNAVKFSEPGNSVEVRVRDDAGAAAIVEIADTGTGIPADELDGVWSELARGRLARGYPGTGMGLSLVRTVIQRHGGTCSLRSQEGQGTVATVRLPSTG